MIYHIALLFSAANFVCMNASGSCTALRGLWMSPSYLNKAGSLLRGRREGHNWKFHCVSQEPVILWEDKTFLSFLPAFSALLHVSVCHVLRLVSAWRWGKREGTNLLLNFSHKLVLQEKIQGFRWCYEIFLLTYHSVYTINRKLFSYLLL